MKYLRLPVLIITLTVLPFVAATSYATLVVPPSFAQLVRESDYVVHAVVQSITPFEKAASGGRSLIYSRVALTVKEVIIGQPPQPVVLEVLGGKLGNRAMYVAGAPRFKVGEEAIFFVQGNGAQIIPLAGMMHGIYPILQNKVTGKPYVTRSNGQPMTDVAEVQHAMVANIGGNGQASASQALTPEAFVLQIRATASSLRSHAK